MTHPEPHVCSIKVLSNWSFSSFTSCLSYRVLQLLPCDRAGTQQQSQLSLFSSPRSPLTSARYLQKEKWQLEWANVCVFKCLRWSPVALQSNVQQDRMLLSLFSECDLHKQVIHKAAAARTYTEHPHTYLTRTHRGYTRSTNRHREGMGRSALGSDYY